MARMTPNGDSIDRRAFIARGLALTAAGIATRIFPFDRASGAPTSLFADSFKRSNTSRGWKVRGKPWFNQRYMSKWGVASNKGFYDLPAPYTVNDPTDPSVIGAGDFNPNPVLLLDHDVAELDMKALISSNNAHARFGFVARVIGYSDYYGVYLDSDKLVTGRFKENREDDPAAPKKMPFAVQAGKSYWLRVQVIGATSPVTIRAKVWKSGTQEPRRWTSTVQDQDSAKSIVKPGAFGFLFMHDAVDRKPVRFKVSKMKVRSLQTAPKTVTPPRITYAFAGATKEQSDGSLRTRLIAKTDIPADVVFRISSTDPRLRIRNSQTVAADEESFAKFGVAKALTPKFQPGETIYWQPIAKTQSGGRSRVGVQSFKIPDKNQDVEFAFGSCTNFYPPSESFRLAANLASPPLFYAHLGDFGYPQDVSGAALALRADCFQDRWARMFARQPVATLHQHTAWLMSQDDHDYGANNVYKDTFKTFTLEAWDRVSANDYPAADHRYFDLSYGDVHSFFVNTRQYADDPETEDGSEHSLLGQAQKTWLKRKMSSSSAKLLVVFATMPLWGPGKDLHPTTWKSAFANERRDLMDFFFSIQGTNRRVLICSGNSHAQYVNRFPNPDPAGKDLFEFVSSGTDRVDANRTPVGQGLPPDALDPNGWVDDTRYWKSKDGFGHVRYQAPQGRITLRAIDAKNGTDIWDPLTIDL